MVDDVHPTPDERDRPTPGPAAVSRRSDARLRELAAYIGAGPWQARRSPVDDGLVLYDGDGEPLALIYAGSDFAHYLEQCAPAILLAETDG